MLSTDLSTEVTQSPSCTCDFPQEDGSPLLSLHANVFMLTVMTLAFTSRTLTGKGVADSENRRWIYKLVHL